MTSQFLGWTVELGQLFEKMRTFAAIVLALALAASDAFADTTDGLAGTAEGGFFRVYAAPDGSGLSTTLYRKVSGAAVLVQAILVFLGFCFTLRPWGPFL